MFLTITSETKGFKERAVDNDLEFTKCDGNILYADGPYVFTDTGISDRVSGKAIFWFRFPAATVALDDNGYVYLTKQGSGGVQYRTRFCI